jgi:hypothetical protein
MKVNGRLHAPGNNHGTHWIEGSVDIRAILDEWERRKVPLPPTEFISLLEPSVVMKLLDNSRHLGLLKR